MNRREFLKLSMLTILLLTNNLYGQTVERRLFLYRNGIGRIEIKYFDGIDYDKDGYLKFCAVCADIQSMKVIPLDPKLMDMLWIIQNYYYFTTGKIETINILSGYRTITTNKYCGGVNDSYHLKGKALDFNMYGINPLHLATIVAKIGYGGLGYYQKRGFVHADTGLKRVWIG